MTPPNRAPDSVPYPPYPSVRLLAEEPETGVAPALDALARYRAHLVRTIGTIDEMMAALRLREGAVAATLQRGDRVRLLPSYTQHIDNVGAKRLGRWLRRGTGDWTGFVLVDFTESDGTKTWVPDNAVVPK